MLLSGKMPVEEVDIGRIILIEWTAQTREAPVEVVALADIEKVLIAVEVAVEKNMALGAEVAVEIAMVAVMVRTMVGTGVKTKGTVMIIDVTIDSVVVTMSLREAACLLGVAER